MGDERTAAHLLRDLRERQGRSLRGAAAELGIAPSYLSRIERGERALPIDLSKRASTYYSIPEELLNLAQGHLPADILQILMQHPEQLERLRSEYGGESDASNND